MPYQSKNMNYIFSVEYYKGIFDKSKEEKVNIIAKRNEDILNFSFKEIGFPTEWEELENYHGFSLYTLYPGLLVGAGYPHLLAIDGAMKLGFSFDYVTGLPYIPGSSLKGMLRSFFPGDSDNPEKNQELTSFIKGILNKENIDVLKLKEDIFENNDVFLGAFPIPEQDGKLMEMEYITPHKSEFKSPQPISLVKVKPDVKFTFSFLLSDYADETTKEVIVSAAEKEKLFCELILLMGIGAKTNVGFGKFFRRKVGANVLVEREKKASGNSNNTGNSNNSGNSNNADAKPVCKKCGKPVFFNENTGRYYPFCPKCNKERNAQNGGINNNNRGNFNKGKR